MPDRMTRVSMSTARPLAATESGIAERNERSRKNTECDYVVPLLFPLSFFSANDSCRKDRTLRLCGAIAAFLGILLAVAPRGASGQESSDFREIISRAKAEVFPALIFVKPIVEDYESGEKKQQEVFGSGVIISSRRLRRDQLARRGQGRQHQLRPATTSGRSRSSSSARTATRTWPCSSCPRRTGRQDLSARPSGRLDGGRRKAISSWPWAAPSGSSGRSVSASSPTPSATSASTPSTSTTPGFRRTPRSIRATAAGP